MKTYQEMLDEIKHFPRWRDQLCDGVPGFLHGPQLCIHVSWTNGIECRVTTVDCMCGEDLDYNAFTAPSHQPNPLLWEGLQAFYKHLGEKQEQEKLREEQACVTH